MLTLDIHSHKQGKIKVLGLFVIYRSNVNQCLYFFSFQLVSLKKEYRYVMESIILCHYILESNQRREFDMMDLFNISLVPMY